MNCTVQIFNNGASLTEKDILDLVFKNANNAIFYNASRISTNTVYVGKQKKLVKRESLPAISTSLPANCQTIGVYFLLSQNKKKLLYIGKDNNVAKRLKEHLIIHNQKTKSQMNHISDYLLKQNRNRILYYYIPVNSAQEATILENQLIWYVKKNAKTDSRLDKVFNIRK